MILHYKLPAVEPYTDKPARYVVLYTEYNSLNQKYTQHLDAHREALEAVKKAVNTVEENIKHIVEGTVPDDSLTTEKLKDNIVTTAKIVDGAVTADKLLGDIPPEKLKQPSRLDVLYQLTVPLTNNELLPKYNSIDKTKPLPENVQVSIVNPSLSMSKSGPSYDLMFRTSLFFVVEYIYTLPESSVGFIGAALKRFDYSEQTKTHVYNPYTHNMYVFNPKSDLLINELLKTIDYYDRGFFFDMCPLDCFELYVDVKNNNTSSTRYRLTKKDSNSYSFKDVNGAGLPGFSFYYSSNNNPNANYDNILEGTDTNYVDNSNYIASNKKCTVTRSATGALQLKVNIPYVVSTHLMYDGKDTYTLYDAGKLTLGCDGVNLTPNFAIKPLY